jgi:hypothetical protein
MIVVCAEVVRSAFRGLRKAASGSLSVSRGDFAGANNFVVDHDVSRWRAARERSPSPSTYNDFDSKRAHSNARKVPKSREVKRETRKKV